MENIVNGIDVSGEKAWISEHIKDHDVILAGFGGSHSYGTNIEGSDVDIRGAFKENYNDLVDWRDTREEYTSKQYDITIYSLRKIVKLLCNCNPNVIELLGLKPEHYIIRTWEGDVLINNSHAFLSKRAIESFGGYAKSQLNRLVNRSGRANDLILQNEERSIQKALVSFKDRYKLNDDDYITNFIGEDEESIRFDLKLSNLSIDKFSNIINELNSIHRSYKRSERNDKATTHNKLSKHMMHLIRLYMMGIDILDKYEIITYREDEHDLLMSIRRGEFLEDDGLTPSKAFEELLDEYSSKFDEACKTTTLPDKPNYEYIKYLMRTLLWYNRG